jgi:hypothetical protein
MKRCAFTSPTLGTHADCASISEGSTLAVTTLLSHLHQLIAGKHRDYMALRDLARHREEIFTMPHENFHNAAPSVSCFGWDSPDSRLLRLDDASLRWTQQAS